MEFGWRDSAEHRARRPVRAGRFRKAVAGLLVLAVLALSAAPSAAWLTAWGGQGHHAAALDCGSDHAAPALHGLEHPDDGHAPAPAACCVALGCPMLLGDMPAAPAHLRPPEGPSVRASAAVRQLGGLDIPPDPPPPRRRGA